MIDLLKDPTGTSVSLAAGLLDCATEPLAIVSSRQGIVMANRAFRQEFGLDHEAAVGVRFDSLFDGFDRETVAAAFQSSSFSGRSSWTVSRPRGAGVMILQTFAVPSSPELFFVRLDLDRLTPFRDESNGLASDGFLLTVGSDLRQPLREILSSQILSSHPDEAVAQPSLMPDETISVQGQGVDLGHLFLDVVADLERRGLRGDAEIEIGDGMYVEGDRNQLRLLAHHLMSNALKFLRPGVKGLVQVGTVGDGVIAIQDNGIGIDRSQVGRLHSSIYNLLRDENWTPTGMGLYTIKRIVDRHQGEVWVESEPLRGTTVFLRFPAKPASA